MSVDKKHRGGINAYIFVYTIVDKGGEMVKWLMLPLLAVFVSSGCDSFFSNDENGDRMVSDAGLRHNSDTDDGRGEDTGEDNTGGEDSSGNDDTSSDTGNCEDDDAGEVPHCDAEAALTAFKTNMQPSIDKSCYACHAFAAGGLTMVKEKDDAAVVAQNRINLQGKYPE